MGKSRTLRSAQKADAPWYRAGTEDIVVEPPSIIRLGNPRGQAGQLQTQISSASQSEKISMQNQSSGGISGDIFCLPPSHIGKTLVHVPENRQDRTHVSKVPTPGRAGDAPMCL